MSQYEERKRGAYDNLAKRVRPCNGDHRYVFDSKRDFRFCESCFELEPAPHPEEHGVPFLPLDDDAFQAVLEHYYEHWMLETARDIARMENLLAERLTGIGQSFVNRSKQ